MNDRTPPRTQADGRLADVPIYRLHRNSGASVQDRLIDASATELLSTRWQADHAGAAEARTAASMPGAAPWAWRCREAGSNDYRRPTGSARYDQSKDARERAC